MSSSSLPISQTSRVAVSKPRSSKNAEDNVYRKDLNLDQFNVPGNSENDDFDQVYAANVQSATTAAVKKSTPPVTPTKVVSTPLATPAKVDVQSEKTAVTKPISTTTPPLSDVIQATPSHGRVQSGKAVATPMTSNDVMQATPPPSPGEKVVLNFGPKAENTRWYQRDYVIGGAATSHVTKNTTSLRRCDTSENIELSQILYINSSNIVTCTVVVYSCSNNSNNNLHRC